MIIYPDPPPGVPLSFPHQCGGLDTVPISLATSSLRVYRTSCSSLIYNSYQTIPIPGNIFNQEVHVVCMYSWSGVPLLCSRLKKPAVSLRRKEVYQQHAAWSSGNIQSYGGSILLLMGRLALPRVSHQSTPLRCTCRRVSIVSINTCSVRAYDGRSSSSLTKIPFARGRQDDRMYVTILRSLRRSLL